jgi:hypothetical protein
MATRFLNSAPIRIAKIYHVSKELYEKLGSHGGEDIHVDL